MIGQPANYTTPLEYQARIAHNCPACNKNKEVGSLLCWDCFKGRTHQELPAFKYYDGDFTQWMELANDILR